MTTERKRRKFTAEFKKDAVALVTEQDYPIAKAAQAVDTSENNLQRWKKELEREARGEVLLHHSERGSHYASHAYQALLRQQGMVCSMSRKGNCWDNAPTERFFSSQKREWLTGNVYPTREDAVADVRAYIVYYNSRRLHTTLGDLTPIEFEQCA